LSKSATAPQLPFDPNESSSGTAAWKQEVNQKLAAHRNRRGASQEDAGASAASAASVPRTASAKAAEAAARVAARYAKVPSYNQVLAGEARAAVRAAGAAAEAARHAQAAAQAVLAGLEFEPELQAEWESRSAVSVPAAAQQSMPARWQDAPPEAAPVAEPVRTPWAGAQPRWEEALPVVSTEHDVWSEMRIGSVPRAEYRHEDAELHSYDAVGHATVEPIQHIPANLIEFPRELTATRKARPRLAEGPLYDAAEDEAQLNIFEVDPELLAPPIAMNAATSGSGHEVAPPEWASIRLDHHPEPAYAYQAEPVEQAYADMAHLDTQYAYASEAAVAQAVAAPVAPAPVEAEVIRETPVRKSAAAQEQAAAELVVARLSDRLLASVVDGALVTLAYIAAAVVVIASTAHPPTGKIALIASGIGLVIFGLLYQFLFLSYAEEGTPGMRYARIALCTFSDDNPTREQMRMRIPAMVVAAIPAGLGLVWALFDGDHLGWHDRLTKTYQRKY
jgi:uncharacterized RDD family membrane protein YckC